MIFLYLEVIYFCKNNFNKKINMLELVIKNLPREFRSLEIDLSDYNEKRAERFIENLREFVEDERLSNEIMKSEELTEVLDLISKNI